MSRGTKTAIALVDLVKTKQAGREVEPAPTPRPSNVINLMDALRRSIETEKTQSRKTKAAEPQPAPAETTPPKRRVAAAAAPRDRVRKSPRPKKNK